MVEILRRGLPQHNFGRDVTCRNCNSVMRYQHGEGRFVADARDGDAMVYDCPVCRKAIWTVAYLHDRAGGKG